MRAVTFGLRVRQACVRRRAFGAGVAVLAAWMSVSHLSAQSALQIRVLSNPRPDRVSGGDVLSRLTCPPARPRATCVSRSTAPTSRRSFRPDASGLTLTGLLTGLAIGPNTVAASGRVRTRGARLTVVNHPNAGPGLFRPSRAAVRLRDAELQAAVRRDAGRAARRATARSPRASTTSIARRPAASSSRLPTGAPLPADAAMVTTLTGQTVPYVVRIETGTINRAIYQIAMLHNPAREPAPDVIHAIRRLERPADLHLRRRLHGRLVPAGRFDRRRRSTMSCCSGDMPSRRPR